MTHPKIYNILNLHTLILFTFKNPVNDMSIMKDLIK